MYILGINAYHGGASAGLAQSRPANRRGRRRALQPQQILGRLSGAVDQVCAWQSGHPSANMLKKALFAFQRRPSLKFVTDHLLAGQQG